MSYRIVICDVNELPLRTLPFDFQCPEAAERSGKRILDLILDADNALEYGARVVDADGRCIWAENKGSRYLGLGNLADAINADARART